MASSDLIEFEGVVTEACRGGTFRVVCPDHGDVEILAHVSGRMRKNRIQILMGDRVTVEVSPYDLSRGRITYRFR